MVSSRLMDGRDVEAVKRIDALLDIEREINGLTAEERLRARRKESAALAAELEDWMRAERAKLSRDAAIAKAMDYMLTRWGAAASLATRFAFSNCATAPRTCRIRTASACRRGTRRDCRLRSLNPKPLQKPEASLLRDEIAGEARSVLDQDHADAVACDRLRHLGETLALSPGFAANASIRRALRVCRSASADALPPLLCLPVSPPNESLPPGRTSIRFSKLAFHWSPSRGRIGPGGSSPVATIQAALSKATRRVFPPYMNLTTGLPFGPRKPAGSPAR